MAACRMRDTFDQHIPVLLNEAVSALVTAEDGVYVDATFGRGSHSQAILDKLGANGRLIAIDKDPEAVAFAKQRFAGDARFKIVHASFAELERILTNENVMGRLHGILFDLGVSSPQLDNPVRGFSFSQDGKLDMRMDTTQGIDAATWLATVPEKELADVLFQYGDEKYSRRIAKSIVARRVEAPITTTAQLASIILHAMPKQKGKWDKHPATRSFQAIRIAINDELGDLRAGLLQGLNALQAGGRMAVISFHSLEDRIVKHFMREQEKGQELPRGLPVKGGAHLGAIKVIGKPVKPGMEELNLNPRARSAILRIAEKQS